MAIDTSPAGGLDDPLPERGILEGFDLLIAADRLFGADLNSSIIKKSGKGTPFLVRRPPSNHRMLALMASLGFEIEPSPDDPLLRRAVKTIRG